MKVLILTPWVPYPITGACQQDRFYGMKQMQSLGYDIRVIAKIHDFQPREETEAAFRKENIPLMLVPHLRHPWGLFFRKLPRVWRNPGVLDGAALEYMDPSYQTLVFDEIERFKPDVLWLEYSTLWPMVKALKPLGIPIILKSSLHEPKNCVDEHGNTFASRMKALPKYFGEGVVAREADMVLAITPNEERWYRSLGATRSGVLPLRGLSRCFCKKTHTDKHPLDVVFLSSNYNMGHNRDAFEFLVTQIVPLVRKELPGKFQFHLTGSKFPDRYKKYLASDVTYEGFIPNLGEFLKRMDIAVCPWITGQGMQQKVFEPLCRSLPLLTTKTGGYPFEHGKEVLLCKTPEEYVECLRKLLDPAERNRIAEAAYRKAETLFSESAVKEIVRNAIEV